MVQPDFLRHIFNRVFIPIIGFSGFLGNILNLAILSWRCNKREVDVLERGALLGLIALAVSDLCFCVGILPKLCFYEANVVFSSKNFEYYFQVYGVYFHNVFIKVSTWLTVIIATARYVAICHPLRARIFTGLFATKVAIIDTYVIWFILMSPLLWSHDAQQHTFANEIFYIIDLGYFQQNLTLKLTFTYIWALIGYFIPVAVLTFCNINLIRALRQSRKWRECSARSAPSGRDANVRITSTLVALIAMFLVLVSPSELIHFYSDVRYSRTSYPAIEMGILYTNLLQSMNFAFHFVLYCAVNVTFRRTIVKLFQAAMRKLRRDKKRKEIKRRRSLSMTRGAPSITKSIETNM